jgi:Na+-driven multidrug efflux pump
MEEISALQKQWNNRALFRLLWPLMLEQLGFGALGVWIGMSADFFARSACYSWRYLHGRWQTKKII